MAPTYICEVCGDAFKSRFNLVRHKKGKHKTIIPKSSETEEGYRHVSLRCPLCPNFSKTANELNSHFNEEHGIIIDTERHEFPNESEFFEFKNKTENDTFSHFFTKRGEKVLADGKKSTIYYCHRSGWYVPKIEKNRIRKLKAQGSAKLNANCPAKIKAVQHKSGRVEVEYTTTHIGHGRDIFHLHLYKKETCTIPSKRSRRKTDKSKGKCKRSLKIPFKEILENSQQPYIEFHYCSGNQGIETIETLQEASELIVGDVIYSEMQTDEKPSLVDMPEEDMKSQVFTVAEAPKEHYVMAVPEEINCTVTDSKTLEEQIIIVDNSTGTENSVLVERNEEQVSNTSLPKFLAISSTEICGKPIDALRCEVLNSFEEILNQIKTEEGMKIVISKIKSILPTIQNRQNKKAASLINNKSVIDNCKKTVSPYLKFSSNHIEALEEEPLRNSLESSNTLNTVIESNNIQFALMKGTEQIIYKSEPIQESTLVGESYFVYNNLRLSKEVDSKIFQIENLSSSEENETLQPPLKTNVIQFADVKEPTEIVFETSHSIDQTPLTQNEITESVFKIEDTQEQRELHEFVLEESPGSDIQQIVVEDQLNDDTTKVTPHLVFQIVFPPGLNS